MVRYTKQASARLVLKILPVQFNAHKFHLYIPLLHIV